MRPDKQLDAFFDAVGGSYTATYDGPLDPSDATVPGNHTPASRTAGRKAPRVTISKRTVRASRSGVVTVRVSCPRSVLHCQVSLALRRGQRRLAHRSVTIGGGKTAKVALRLTHAARKHLARAGSLRVDVVATTSGAARSHVTSRTRIRVLAPRRRGAR